MYPYQRGNNYSILLVKSRITCQYTGTFSTSLCTRIGCCKVHRINQVACPWNDCSTRWVNASTRHSEQFILLYKGSIVWLGMSSTPSETNGDGYLNPPQCSEGNDRGTSVVWSRWTATSGTSANDMRFKCRRYCIDGEGRTKHLCCQSAQNQQHFYKMVQPCVRNLLVQYKLFVF